MSPVKYSVTTTGKWARDGNNLPCLQLEGVPPPAAESAWLHIISTGRFAAAADPFGRIRLLLPDTRDALCLSPVPGPAGGLFLTLTSPNGMTRGFLAGELRSDNQPAQTCGIGYVSYSGELDFGNDGAVALSLDLAAPPDASTFLILKLSLRLLRGGVAAFTGEVTVDLAPTVTAGAPLRSFCRQATAMFTEIRDSLGDLFLAGDDAWKASAQGHSLALLSTINLAPRKPVIVNLLVGVRHDCSLSWIQKQLQAADPGAACKAWAGHANPNPIKVPDLWIQEECLWNNGQVLACRTWDTLRQTCVLAPGGDVFPLKPAANGRPRTLPVRDSLMLCLAERERFPEPVLATLHTLAASQAGNGRLPEQLGDAPPMRVTAATDRSDLELWFLLAWADAAGAVADPDPLLAGLVPYATGGQATIWEHLWAAYRWLRESIQTGPHGLVRMLAGDGCAFLNAVGTEGRGESVVNSAMAILALEKLAELARRRDETRRAEELDAWIRELRDAVNAAFAGRWFRRGYTDAGTPFGDQAEGRLFLDAQAWAVLACCGTSDQRECALEEGMNRCAGDAGLRLLSVPYPVPPPPAISRLRLPGGEGGNGGVSLPVAHWFLWAMALHGKKPRAMLEWERLAQRRLAMEYAGTATGRRFTLPEFASDLAGDRAGGPGISGDPAVDAAPAAHAVAWQEFALRRILG